MILSNRLKHISDLVTEVKSIVDVGTDHAYIPIYLVKNNIVRSAIASDINKGPVDKAKKNVKAYALEDKITCRLGGGLTTVSPKEVEVAIIAGMGGNLIRDIIEDSMEVFKELSYAILQPVQNPEVLREYIYKKGFTILDETIVKDEDKYYEVIKVKYDKNLIAVDPIYYEISEILLKKKDPIFKEYVEYKLNKYNRVYENLKEETELAIKRKSELKTIIEKLKEFLQCL